MRDRRGYLDRLVDNPARDRAARLPRPIAWGPTKPAGAPEHEYPGPEMKSAAAPVRESGDTGRVDQPEPVTPQASTDRAREAVRTVVQPLRVVPSTPTTRDGNAPSTTTVQQVVAPPPLVKERHPSTARPTTSVERTEQRVVTRPVAAEPPRTPTPATEPRLPDEVRYALDRLAALSKNVPQVPPTAVVRDPSPPPPPAPAEPPRQVAKQPAAVVPRRQQRSTEPTRTPHVHIGSIEVTVAEPTPPPPPPVAPPAPQPPPAAPAPVGRLSRPFAGFGFGQV